MFGIPVENYRTEPGFKTEPQLRCFILWQRLSSQVKVSIFYNFIVKFSHRSGWTKHVIMLYVPMYRVVQFIFYYQYLSVVEIRQPSPHRVVTFVKSFNTNLLWSNLWISMVSIDRARCYETEHWWSPISSLVGAPWWCICSFYLNTCQYKIPSKDFSYNQISNWFSHFLLQR